MRSSTFNFLVAMFCAAMAVFGNQESFFVVLNLSLALLNLFIGIKMHKLGN